MTATGSPAVSSFEAIADWMELFDPQWYLATNGDVAAAGVDPGTHYATLGAREGRWPNPLFDTAWYANTYPSFRDQTENPLEHFFNAGAALGYWPNGVTDTLFVTRTYGLDPVRTNPLFFILRHPHHIDRLSEWFSRRAYLRMYPDVAASGVPPEHHFIRQGVAEGRCPHPDYCLEEIKPDAERHVPRASAVDEVRLGQRAFRILLRLTVPDTIAVQVRAQGRIDPHVFAAGARTISRARQISAVDLLARRNIDFQSLLQQCGPDRAYRCVVILPKLQIGGAERYAAQLARFLELENRPTLVVTTDSTPESDHAALVLDIFRSLRHRPVLSLGPHLERVRGDSFFLSMLLMMLRPDDVFVFNSRAALQAIRYHGKAISAFARIHVGFFSESPEAVGAPYSARYLPYVLAVGEVISDNQAAIDHLQSRSPAPFRGRFRLLPQPIEIPDAQRLAELELARRRRERSSLTVRILWASRWEPFKATEVVEQVARLRSDFEIDVFGPADSAAATANTNIRFCGSYSSIEEIDIGAYDVFMFTSWFEGMPNVVLEMGALGIPIVASDAGGLRETFGDRLIEYVDMNGNVDEIAARFCERIDRLTAQGPAARSSRAAVMREAIARRHSPNEFRRGVRVMLANAETIPA